MSENTPDQVRTELERRRAAFAERAIPRCPKQRAEGENGFGGRDPQAWRVPGQG